jgi:hypothetical protein
MRSIPTLIVAALLLGLACPPAQAAPAAAAPAEAEMQTLATTIRANRRALVSVNLNLTSEEAARFWPLYDRYQAEITVIGDKVVALVDDYIANFRDLSDEKAVSLMTDYLAAEAERLKIRQAYLPKFLEVLPGRTVARFYQIENKMDAVVRYDLAATIPVVEDGNAPAAAK